MIHVRVTLKTVTVFGNEKGCAASEVKQPGTPCLRKERLKKCSAQSTVHGVVINGKNIKK